MVYDRCRSEEAAKKAAKIYVTIHGWDRVEYGRLVREDGGPSRWAVQLPSRKSPRGKIADVAHEVGPGYAFEKTGALRKKSG